MSQIEICLNIIILIRTPCYKEMGACNKVIFKEGTVGPKTRRVKNYGSYFLMKQLLEAGVHFGQFRLEDGILKWLLTSSQKETESISSTCRRL